jgi:hypothetical protein
MNSKKEPSRSWWRRPSPGEGWMCPRSWW